MHSLDKNTVSSVLNEKAGFQIWWRLLRPHTLTASFIPVFVGTMAASLKQPIDFLLFLAMLLASILIQSATNMFNEYYDFVRGLDDENSVGIGGTIVRDGVAPKVILSLALTFFAIAMILGVYICLESSWLVAVIGLISMLCGYLYTGGPYPIAYTPLGELVAGFFMGTIIIGISYYIQTLTLSSEVLLISVPVAVFIGTIMLSNNIRDLEGDKENGRKTAAILIGRKNAIALLAFLFSLSYIVTIVYVLASILPVWSLLTLLSVGKAISAVKGFKGKTVNIEMMPAMKATAQTNTFFGLLLGLSLLIQLVISLTF